jgi:hypothetical protein
MWQVALYLCTLSWIYALVFNLSYVHQTICVYMYVSDVESFTVIRAHLLRNRVHLTKFYNVLLDKF